MIAELLDSYLLAVKAAGLLCSPARPGPDGEIVRRQLRDAGYEAGDDLVDFLSWTSDWYADHWFPLLVVDGQAEFVAIDSNVDSPTSGAVFYLHPSAENFKMFSSLAEAIETAIYCVHAGLWTVEEDGYTIVCDRESAPDPVDLTNPPWA